MAARAAGGSEAEFFLAKRVEGEPELNSKMLINEIHHANIIEASAFEVYKVKKFHLRPRLYKSEAYRSLSSGPNEASRDHEIFNVIDFVGKFRSKHDCCIVGSATSRSQRRRTVTAVTAKVTPTGASWASEDVLALSAE